MKPLPPTAKNVAAILAMFDTPRPTGITRADVRAEVEFLNDQVLQATIAQMLRMGRLHRCGKVQRYRYFPSAAAMEAAAPALAALAQAEIAQAAERESQRAERAAAYKRQQREWAKAKVEREAKAVAAKASKPKKQKDAPAPVTTMTAPVEHPRQRDFMGNTLVTKHRLRADATIIIPEGVTVQTLPGFTCDTRFQVEQLEQPCFSALRPGVYPFPPSFGGAA